MSDEPLISIVLPVYNGARYLPEALASVSANEAAGAKKVVMRCSVARARRSTSG